MKAEASGIPVFCAHDKVVPISELKPNLKNPNIHPESQIELLAEVINTQGWRAPITVSMRSGLVVRGHGRLAAALLLGVNEAPVDYQDYASEAEEWADLVADNRLAELSETDNAKLAAILGEIDAYELPMSLTGYSEEDYDNILASLSEESVTLDMVDDTAPEPPEKPFTIPGDEWRVGKHVLICGDATNEKSIANLMRKDKADLIITDPPYNNDYVGKTKGRLKIENDKKANDSFGDFLHKAFSNMRKYAQVGAASYIFYAHMESVNFMTAFIESGFALKQGLVWVKNTFVLGRQDYQWRHELILYGWIEGKAHYFIDDRKQDTIAEEEVLTFEDMKKSDLIVYIRECLAKSELNTTAIYEDRPTRSEAHPTMKPVRLIARLMQNSSRVGELVLDPFAGSGTTLIAAEHLNRRARCLEIDPRYCDVIVKRYVQVTGKKDIVCIRDGKEVDPKKYNALLTAPKE
jgi:DNA modification methylase